MLFKEEYISLDVDVTSKKQLLSYIASRACELSICDDQNTLLKDLEQREKEVSTGLQDGFAIPHARSKSVKEPSILYIKTEHKLEWGTLDDSLVECVFALLVPAHNEANVHMQMLSKLATCLIEDEFKETVKSAKDVKELTAYIYKNMEVK